MKKTDLSVIVLSHNEGILAHKTMLSVFRSLDFMAATDLAYEIVIHIDDGDDATVDYFSRYKDNAQIQIINSSYSDAGLSRNRAIEAANGDSIALVNAGDLISENWFSAALNLLSGKEHPVIIRPEAVVWIFPLAGFISPAGVQLNTDSQSKEYEAIRMIGNNPWPSCLMARKDLLQSIPFKSDSENVVAVDMAFNCDVISRDIKHAIAPETVLFYRRKNNYWIDRQRLETTPPYYSELFSADFMQSIEIPDEDELLATQRKKPAFSIKNLLIQIYEFMLRIPKVSGFVERLYLSWRNTRESSIKSDLPVWLIEEWKNINVLDYSVFPGSESLNCLQEFDKADCKLGWVYRQLIEGLPNNIDYLLIVPWLIRGGADKVALLYVMALAKIYPGKQLAVLATLDVENPWRDRLPEGVSFIDFGNLTNSLSDNEKDLLLSRLMIQLQIQNIHILQSRLGYTWVADHLDYLSKKGINLFVSAFSYGFTDEGQYTGYSDPYLINIYPLVKIIAADNAKFTETLVDGCGFAMDKIAVHYMPVFIKPLPPRTIDESRKIRIIWASRIVRSKLPYVLIKIAESLDGSRFHIDAYGEVDTHQIPANIFKRVPNLTYCGSYDGTGSLQISDYDIYLYTTISDGMPNVLLEMAAKGLPILATNVGGVGELIQDGVTGCLVDDPDNIDDYVAKLNEMASDPIRTRELAVNAQKLVSERHDFNHFVEQVRQDLSLL